MKTTDLAWLAGLIEGEGTFTKAGPRTSCGQTYRIQVHMTDEDVVRRCHEITKRGSVTGPYREHEGRKPMWVWAVHRQRDVASLCMTLYPLLGARRQEKVREVLREWRAATRRIYRRSQASIR